jgi:RimJ/RimL family protein N-acetyltransferase
MASQKEMVKRHFLFDLTTEDRHLRFGYTPSDTAIEKYIDDTFGVANSRWFGIEAEGKIIATCHAFFEEEPKQTELGLTVSPEFRGKGLGDILFKRGVVWARSRGSKSIFMHCLSENKVIQHIALKNGMQVIPLAYGEKEALIETNFSPLVRYSDAALDSMALFDNTIRKQRWLVKLLMRGLYGS